MLEKTLVDSIKQNHSLTQAQQLALGKFIDKGFPTSKWEEWKYASLKHLNEFNWLWSPETLSVNFPKPDWKHSAIFQSYFRISLERKKSYFGSKFFVRFK
jgi:hypothetical protein